MDKIADSGVYRTLPMRQYHSDCCIGPSVSSTVLRAAESHSLRHAWAASHLNADRQFDPSKHFRIGSALHALCFEGKLDRMDFVRSPYTEFRTKEAREWRDRRLAEGKYIIRQEDYGYEVGAGTIQKMLDSLLEHPLIRTGLFDERGELECSIILKDAETGMFLKSRPDCIPCNSILCDLKTTRDARRRSVERSIIEYGYAQQMAVATECMEKVLGAKIDSWVLVFVESAPPYCVNICELDQDFIGWAKLQNRRALRRFADCLSKGREMKHFPPYEGEFVMSAPSWMTERLTKEQSSGLLPTFAECGYLGG